MQASRVWLARQPVLHVCCVPDWNVAMMCGLSFLRSEKFTTSR